MIANTSYEMGQIAAYCLMAALVLLVAKKIFSKKTEAPQNKKQKPADDE